MIIVMQKNATAAELENVIQKIRSYGLIEHISKGSERTLIGAIGDERQVILEIFERMDGVERAMKVLKDYQIVSREVTPNNTEIHVRGLTIGGNGIQVIAGPSVIESEDQMKESAITLKKYGAKILRAGTYSKAKGPWGFQGLGLTGLEYLSEAAHSLAMPFVTELCDPRMLETYLEYDVDIIKISAHNMFNTDLLKEVGRINKPILLYRNFGASIEEWLMAAEYIAAGGNHNIIFCESGIRSFEKSYRYTLDLAAVAILKQETHLPVFVNPSHALSKDAQVRSMALAAIAAGADGLVLEYHPNPSAAWSEGDIALNDQQILNVLADLKALCPVLGRSF